MIKELKDFYIAAYACIDCADKEGSDEIEVSKDMLLAASKWLEVKKQEFKGLPDGSKISIDEDEEAAIELIQGMRKSVFGSDE